MTILDIKSDYIQRVLIVIILNINFCSPSVANECLNILITAILDINKNDSFGYYSEIQVLIVSMLDINENDSVNARIKVSY